MLEGIQTRILMNFLREKSKDIKIPKNALYLKSFEQLHELLSLKRLDLLLYLMDVPQKRFQKQYHK